MADTNHADTIDIAALARARPDGRARQLIDVRSTTEFAAGHLPCAINIPMAEIESRLPDLDTATPIVLVCQSGRRATMVAERLAARGVRTQVLTGGTAAWTAAGHYVVTSVNTRWSLERQVRLGAGLLVLAGITLALAVDARWMFLAALAGVGLTFAGLTDICLLGALLARMPWNRPIAS
jgi:rhodanese-related sulfurtransferase